MPNGSAILPVLSNPGPEAPNPAAAPGQAPTTNVVSVDAEAFAAAGGRMTSWEWQQLQRFRDAVTDSKSMPVASPLMLQAEQLVSHSLTTGEPGVSFAVKQAVLTPHRRLMDSVCRFAFPATHGLLAAGWQLQSSSQQTAATGSAAAGIAAVQAAASQGRAQVQQEQQHAAQVAQASQQQQQQHLQGLLGQQVQQSIALPVPAPAALQPVGTLAAVVQQPGPELSQHQAVSQPRVGSDHGSSGGCLQVDSNQHAAAPSGTEAEPAGLSRWGSLATPAAPTPAAHAAVAAGTRPADPALQLRVQAAAGAAAAAAVGRSSGQGMACRQSWGSAGGADSQEHSMQQRQQSWGSEVSAAGASTASCLSVGGLLQLCQHMAGPAPAAGPGQGPQQAGTSAGQAHRAHVWCCDGASSDGQQAAASIPAGGPAQQQQQPDQQCLLEGAGSIPAAPAGAMQVPQSPAAQLPGADGILELPAAWQPSSTRNAALTKASCAGAREGAPAAGPTADAAIASVGTEARSSSSSTRGQAVAALQRALVEDFVLYEEASAARQHVVGILVAVEQGDAAAGQRLLAPACAELIAATAPAAVPNRLAPFLSSPAVANAAATARTAGLGPAEASAAVAVAAAEEYCRHVQGISRLLGSASTSRAALEASPRQLRQQRQQQQVLLVRALQQVSNRVPWLSRLLTPLQQSLGLDTANENAVAAAAGAVPAQQQDSQVPHRRSSEQQATQHPHQGAAQEHLAASEQAAVQLAHGAEADAGQSELQAAVVELIMQLPELLHGLPGPALLTYEQYRQRYTQAQQLAAHAMQLLLPGAGADEGAAAAAADGVAAELAASGLLAAASAAMAASQAAPSADPASNGGAPGQHQTSAGHLFANILDSLRGPGINTGAEHAAGTAEAALAAAYGAGRAAGSANGFLSRTAAFAAANRLADGLIRPAHAMPAASIGLSRAGSLAGPGQLGAWRLPVGAAVAGAASGLLTPGAGAAAGGLGLGMFAPTGTGALLSGGLLAEGGVAGDSILDDVLHGNVRRITCHGLYELCAALAQPAGVQGSPTAAVEQHQGAEAGFEAGPAHSQMETDDSSNSSEGRVIGQHVAEAVATVAAAAVAVESNRRSSTHSMGPPAPGGLCGAKRRLSSTLDEQERPLKH